MTDHLGETAALYALGALEPREQAEADQHLAACDACRRLLAQAQADVTAMAAAQPQFEPPAALGRRIANSLAAPTQRPRASGSNVWAALAAAIVIALVPTGYLLHENMAMRDAMLSDAQALARVAAGPHRTAAFAGMDAHVMYATDGSWYLIVIRNAGSPLHVMWPHDGTQTMLGTAVQRGNMAFLYLPSSHPMERLALVADGRVVGQAQLVF
jgi:anti-sigma factor RsiW